MVVGSLTLPFSAAGSAFALPFPPFFASVFLFAPFAILDRCKVRGVDRRRKYQPNEDVDRTLCESHGEADIERQGGCAKIV